MNRASSCHMCCGTGGVVALLALAAWLGLPIVAAFLSAIGVQLATVNPLLVPVMIAALGLVQVGLWLGFKSHGNAEPFMIGLVGSASTVIGLLVWTPAAVLGFITIAGTIVFNQYLLVRRADAVGAQ